MTQTLTMETAVQVNVRSNKAGPVATQVLPQNVMRCVEMGSRLNQKVVMIQTLITAMGVRLRVALS